MPTEATITAEPKPLDRANGPTPRTPEAIDQLVADLDKMRAEIVTLSNAVAKVGGKAAGNVRQHAEELTGDVAAAYKAGLGDLGDELTRLESSASRAIRDKPLQAVGIAAGIGFLLALFSRR